MAAALGAALMVLVVAAVVISYLKMTALYEVAATAIYQYHPAQKELLFIDRDLYQAELALERGASLEDAVDRRGQLTIFNENVAQTEARFDRFREGSDTIPDQTGAIGSYVEYRDHWLGVAATLTDGIQEGRSRSELEPIVSQLIDAFGEMRFALDRISSSMMDPAIISNSESMANEASTASTQLIVTLIIALSIGTFVIVLGSNSIRRHHNQMLADRDRQRAEARRKELEKRIRSAFELVQTESAAINVTNGVLGEVTDESHYTELLLADSSFAHLHRATATDMADTKGCKVLRPSDCPAIRRNTQLRFKTNHSFDACPFLKDRTEDDCSALCIPLSVLGRPAGVLHTIGSENDPPAAEEELALLALASHSGDVLGVLRALSTKDRHANTDSLTGLDNRRSLEAKLPAIAARGDYAVAFGDLDKFKILNDTHGHDIGDRALRLFADVLRASLRPDDLAGRWGGEEFVIVLPGATATKAGRALERIRSNLRENLTLGTVPSFTVSFGVADSRQAECPQDVINAADAALLNAKREGRNRIAYGTVGDTSDTGDEAEPSVAPDIAADVRAMQTA